MRNVFAPLNVFMLLVFLISCSSKNSVSGTYLGFYELNVGGNVVCHYLMKKDAALPTVLCHDEDQAWVVPLPEFKNQIWLTAPILTESGSMIAFLSEDKGAKVEVVASVDKGKSWEAYPAFLKKDPADQFSSIVINKKGRLVASFQGTGKKYEVGQAATFKSTFTAIKTTAKAYPEECMIQYRAPKGAKIPQSCLSGYVNRLLNQ